MTYEPTIWKDRAVEFPRRFKDQFGNVLELTPFPGTVLEEGTPVNAANLNKLEQGLKTHEADNVHIPKGLISMWSGLISDIPDGWVLCDGNNGTPNLKDRFIMGATTDATINKTGGKNEVTLTVDQIPAHKHNVSISSAGSHTHTINHSYSYGDKNNASRGGYDKIDGTIPTNSGGSHTHTITINNTGGGQAHENRPAYYTLAFIMKV